MRTTLPRVMPKYRATGSLNWMRGSCVSLTCGSMAQGTGVGRVVGPHVARLRSCQVARGVKRGHGACFGATAWLPGRITDWDGGLPLLLAPRPRAFQHLSLINAPSCLTLAQPRRMLLPCCPLKASAGSLCIRNGGRAASCGCPPSRWAPLSRGPPPPPPHHHPTHPIPLSSRHPPTL